MANFNFQQAKRLASCRSKSDIGISKLPVALTEKEKNRRLAKDARRAQELKARANSFKQGDPVVVPGGIKGQVTEISVNGSVMVQVGCRKPACYAASAIRHEAKL